jgi:hypothetical protein
MKYKTLALLAALLAASTSHGALLGPTNAPASVTLAWDPSPANSGVVFYSLYWGVASRAYTNEVNVIGRTNTTATITNLTRGATYYFAATATATNGLESDFSSEVSWSVGNIPAAPVNTRVASMVP